MVDAFEGKHKLTDTWEEHPFAPPSMDFITRRFSVDNQQQIIKSISDSLKVFCHKFTIV